MTVLDQLRDRDEMRSGYARLADAARDLLDVLSGDLEGPPLHEAFQDATAALSALLDAAEKPDSKPAAPKPAKKSAAKKASRPPASPPAQAGGPADTKACTDCEQTKPLTAFGKIGRGRHKVCDECRAPKATVTSLPPAPRSGEVTAVCPSHGAVKSEVLPRDHDRGLWLAVAQSGHHHDMRCDQQLRLSSEAA